MVNRKRRARGSFASFVIDKEEPKPPSPGQDTNNQRPILDLVSSLYLNSDYSDLVIICGGKSFPAHRLVVCPRSEYFQRACCGRFKEAKEPIDLGNKDPVLIEKVLEFLYKGDYTIGPHIPEGGDPRLDGDGAQGTTMKRTGETAVNDTSENAPDEPMAEVEGATDENALVDGPLGKIPSDQRGSAESIVDPLLGCHPCYIHLRVFGEADYLMIRDLKDRAKEQFSETFKGFHERQFFAEIIEELYSNRADYRGLRKLVMDVVVPNLPTLWKGSAPAIDIELMKTVPDFAIDLCAATMDNYVVKPSDTQPFSTGYNFGGRKSGQ